MAESGVLVILDNQPDAYLPGETVVGKVVCTFVEETIVRTITIRYKGAAMTRWTVKRGKGSSTYSADETYFLQQVRLLDGGEDNTSVAAGVHSYPFSYILPERLPSSFDGEHGRVTFSIKAIVDRPWKLNYVHKLVVRVVSPLDLNSIRGLQQPLTDSVTTDTTCCCWNPGPISVTASLPVKGFVRGQTMGIRCCVENWSNLNVENVNFSIVQLIEYISSNFSRKSKSVLSTLVYLSESGVGAHAVKSWISPFTIPGNMHFPNLELCNIINVAYYLEVKLILPTWYSNIKLNFPITIGTVPLSRTDSEQPSASSPPNESASLLPNTPVFNNNGDPSAPPSYDEAMLLPQ